MDKIEHFLDEFKMNNPLFGRKLFKKNKNSDYISYIYNDVIFQ